MNKFTPDEKDILREEIEGLERLHAQYENQKMGDPIRTHSVMHRIEVIINAFQNAIDSEE